MDDGLPVASPDLGAEDSGWVLNLLLQVRQPFI